MQRFVDASKVCCSTVQLAVLLREERTGTEFRVVPQKGSCRLREGEQVAFGFDPQRVVCFG